MVGLLRLRFAAGVCLLAAGLLMGAGGAVAVADPGSSGSAAHGDDGTNASGQQHSTEAKKPKDQPGGTDTKDGTTDDSDLGAAVPDPVAAVPNEVAPVSDVVAPVPDVVGPVSDVSAVVQDMLTSVAGAVVPLTQLPSDLFFLLGIAGVQPVVGCGQPRVRRWRRDCRWACHSRVSRARHLPVSRACR